MAKNMAIKLFFFVARYYSVFKIFLMAHYTEKFAIKLSLSISSMSLH